MLAIALNCSMTFSGAGAGAASVAASALAAGGGAEIPCNALIRFKSANFSVILSSNYQIFVKIKSKFIA